MPKRRGHGEGSIFRAKDGRWVGELFLGRDTAGKKKVKRIYGRTRAEVAASLTKALRDRQQGLLPDPSRQTVAQFLDAWLDDVVEVSARPNTLTSYRGALKHVSAAIGNIQLQKLTPQHIQRLLRERQAAGMARTAALILAVLRKACSQAVKWGLLARNPCDGVERPKIVRKEFRALNPEEAQRLIRASEGERLGALFVLAVTCGLRLGELLGLRWRDVDLDAGTLTVRQQLQWVATDGKRREPDFSEPKSKKSRRTIALPTAALGALKSHRARQAEERLRLGEAWQDYDLVFTTEVGTPLSPSNVRNRAFLPLLQRAGLPRVRIHDLRHSAASLLIGAGESLKTVQEMLGHSSISLTADVYGHIGLAQQKAAAARMDALLSAAPQKRS